MSEVVYQNTPKNENTEWSVKSVFDKLQQLVQNPSLENTDKKKIGLRKIKNFIKFHLKTDLLYLHEQKDFLIDTIIRFISMIPDLDICESFDSFFDTVPNLKSILQLCLVEPTCVYMVLYSLLLDSQMDSEVRLKQLSYFFSIEPKAFLVYHPTFGYILDQVVKYCDFKTIKYFMNKPIPPAVDIQEKINICAERGELESLQYVLESNPRDFIKSIKTLCELVYGDI